jgi:O-antigen/teichoic acid export membrane protein
MACSLLLVNLILFIKLKNRVKFVKVQIGNVFGCLKDALILFLPVISASVYKTMDKVMIGALIGDMAGVSSYSYAEQLINLPLGITNALAAVMLPRMTNAYANNSKDINKTPDITLLFICFLSSAMAFGLVGISDVFVQLYLGSQYLDCVEYVVLLAPTAIMISWTAMMRTQFLIPKKNDKGYITSIVTGALLNLIINFYLLPRIGIYGAIIGTLVAEGAVMIIQTITAANYYDVKKAIKKGCPFLFFGMIMTIECKVIFAQNGTSWRTLFIQIVIGGCSYLLLSFVYFWKQYKSIIQNK